MTQDTLQYPVELQAPDISAYRTGNRGIDYVHTFDSGKPGPHVMVSAVVHGNEICGAIALDHLFKQQVRPIRGKLTLAFMNVAAYLAFDPKDPGATRFIDEDFNRVWGVDVLEGERDSIELSRARELRPIVDEVDYLFDIHSMFTATVPVIMAGPERKGRLFAQQSGIPQYVISDHGHKAGRRLRDYGGFSDPNSEKNALLLECGQHWEKSSEQVAIESTYRFLAEMEIISPELAEKYAVPAESEKQKYIEVSGPCTIKTDKFRFTEPFTGMELFETKGSVIAWDDEEPVTTPNDDCVLIMPSGRLFKGETAVRFGQLLREI